MGVSPDVKGGWLTAGEKGGTGLMAQPFSFRDTIEKK